MPDLQDLLARYAALEERKSDLSPDEEQEFYRLKDLVVKRIDFVPRGANARRFAVVKTGDDMPDQLETEVIENEDGTLTAVADENVETQPEGVAKVDMPGAAQKGMLKKLMAVSERLMSLVNRVKGATPKEGAQIPADFTREAKELGTLLSGVAGSYPAPGVKEGDKVDKEADQPADPFAELNPLDALAHIEKAGKKMKGESLEKFKKHLAGLQALLKDLEGDPQHRALLNALGMLRKSNEQHSEAVTKALAALPESIKTAFTAVVEASKVAKSDDSDAAESEQAAEPDPVPAGQAEPPSQTTVTKGADVDWGDVVGVDLNESRKNTE